MSVEGGVAARVKQEVISCGGQKGPEDPSGLCFKMRSPQEGWVSSQSMASQRVFPFGVQTDADSWVITGGASHDGLRSDSEMWQHDTFTSGAFNLPLPLNDHCLFVSSSLSSSILHLIGGKSVSDSFSNKFFTRPTSQSEWLEPAPLNKGRNGHFCGQIPDENGQPRLFVAGGYGTGWELLNSTEIYVEELNQWKPGPTLPTPLAYGVSLQRDSHEVLLIGGTMTDQEHNGVFIYQNQEWVGLDISLSVPRSGFMATWVSPEAFFCDSD